MAADTQNPLPACRRIPYSFLLGLAAMAIGATAGCVATSPYVPVVTLNHADAARYQTDLADCRKAADLDQYGPTLAGLAVGASFGAGLGSVAGWLASDNVGLATSFGAISGTAVGGAVGLARSTPPQDAARIDDCLRANGYSVSAPAATGTGAH